MKSKIIKIKYNEIVNKDEIFYEILENNLALIVNNIFLKKEIIAARNEIFDFFKEKEYFNTKSLPFHRWDINPMKSRFMRIMRSASFDSKYRKKFEACINILNRSASLKVKYFDLLARKKILKKKKYSISYRASLYPSGGGYYQKHNDSLSGEIILDIIPLTFLGKEYSNGGLMIGDQKNNDLFVEKLMKIGSAVYIKASTNHMIAPIDPKKKFNKQSFSGRLSLISVFN